jgi:Mn-dependent DtxR family transcriptional regulator
MDLDLTQLKVLLSLYQAKDGKPLLVRLAKRVGIPDYKMSRVLSQLESKGYLHHDTPHTIVVTPNGKELAKSYLKLIGIAKDILVSSTGLPYSEIEEDAIKMAVYCNRTTLETAEKRLAYKSRVCHCNNQCCMGYDCQFTIYRKSLTRECILSMANSGFLHPCTITMCHGGGEINLKPVPMVRKSRFTGLDMSGQLKSLKYYNGKRFVQAELSEGLVHIPLKYCQISVVNSDEKSTILHGSIYIKVSCTVGEMHMPESVAVLTFQIVQNS